MAAGSHTTATVAGDRRWQEEATLQPQWQVAAGGSWEALPVSLIAQELDTQQLTAVPAAVQQGVDTTCGLGGGGVGGVW